MFHYSTAAPLTGKEPSSWSRPRCFVFPALMQSHHSLSSALLLLLKVAPHLLANSPEMFWGGFEIWLMSWPWTIPCWIVWDIRPSALQGHLSWYPHEGHANASSRTQTLVGRLCWGKDIYQNKIHIPHLLLCVSSHKYVVFRWFLFKEEGDPNPGFLHEVLLDWQPQLASNTQIHKYLDRHPEVAKLRLWIGSSIHCLQLVTHNLHRKELMLVNASA